MLEDLARLGKLTYLQYVMGTKFFNSKLLAPSPHKHPIASDKEVLPDINISFSGQGNSHYIDNVVSQPSCLCNGIH